MSTEIINDPLVSGVCLFLAVICLILELFVPSGGILGLLAAAGAVFGIYGLFHQGHTLLASGAILFFIAFFYGGFRFMMRRLSFAGALTPETSTTMDRRILDLVGREGISITPLRPSGMALIEGRKVDVVTSGEYMEKDVPLRVVDNSGNRVVVRPTETRPESRSA